MCDGGVETLFFQLRLAVRLVLPRQLPHDENT